MTEGNIDLNWGQRNLPLTLSSDATDEAERRLQESIAVSPITYIELEYCFARAYSELRCNLAKITYEKTAKEKLLDETKGEALIDSYPKFLEEHPKLKDTADIKKAFLSKIVSISDILDAINTLTAMEMITDSKIKRIEKTCAAMKQKMYLISKSGLTNENLYVSSGK